MNYEDYLPLIYSVIKATKVYRFIDWDDAIQEGGVVFLETLDEEYEHFGAYLKKKLYWHYMNIVKRRLRELGTFTLDYKDDTATLKLNDTIESEENIERNYIRYVQEKQLDEEMGYNIIYVMLKQGFSQKEIGKQLGLSQATISRRIKDIRNKCDEILRR